MDWIRFSRRTKNTIHSSLSKRKNVRYSTLQIMNFFCWNNYFSSNKYKFWDNLNKQMNNMLNNCHCNNKWNILMIFLSDVIINYFIVILMIFYWQYFNLFDNIIILFDFEILNLIYKWFDYLCYLKRWWYLFMSKFVFSEFNFIQQFCYWKLIRIDIKNVDKIS